METKQLEISGQRATVEVAAKVAATETPRSANPAPRQEDAVAVRLSSEQSSPNAKIQEEEKKEEKRSEEGREVSRNEVAELFNFEEKDVEFDVKLNDRSQDLRFRVVDRETREVIREFPPESLRRSKELGTFDPGLLVDSAV